jgi:membrane-associated phospholipid phosphatase
MIRSEANVRGWRSVAAVSLLLLMLGFLVDTDVVRCVALWRPLDSTTRLEQQLLRLPGHFLFTLAICLALSMWHPLHWRAGLLLFWSGALSGILAWVLKWCVGRTRPLKGIPAFELHPFLNGVHGLLGNGNRSFPSGDTALAFASAVCLACLIPRWRWACYLMATVVASQRVLVNAHHVSDAIGGAILGALSFALAAKSLLDFCDVSHATVCDQPLGGVEPGCNNP